MDYTNFGIYLEKVTMRELSVALIVSCPILVLFSQIGLAIREIAVNTRKEGVIVDSDYRSLYWIAYVMFSIGWCCLILGVALLIRTL